MTIELTAEQQKVINTPTKSAHRAVDPQTRAEYVLVAASEYDSIAAILQEERILKGIHKMSAKNMARRMLEES